MLHAISQEHVSWALRETLEQHLNRVLIWYHRVLNSVEDGRWTLDFGHSFEIVEPFLDE